MIFIIGLTVGIIIAVIIIISLIWSEINDIDKDER